MNVQDAAAYAVKNLRTRHVRSWLTIIGVVIGVIAMVVITSVTEGVNQSVNDLLATFGSDMMFVVPINIDSGTSGLANLGPAGMPMGKLYQRDVDSIAGVPGVKETARTVYGRASVGFRAKGIQTAVYGMDPSGLEMYSSYFQLDKGRLYTESERRVAVLGYDAANKFFGNDKLDVGNTFTINGKDYKVVGTLKEIPGSFASQDNGVIILPFDEGRDLFTTQLARNEVTFIYLNVDAAYNMEDVKDAIEHKIAANHRVTLDEKDFSVITSDYIKKTVGSVLDLLGQLLLAITAVATVVGGIGISNTMFMAVLERVREIGILKSVGATDRDIQLIFLTESALIGIAGGVLGFLCAFVILVAAQAFGVPYLIQPKWVAFVFLFSAGVGILAGYLPARQAAKLDPVQALGYI